MADTYETQLSREERRLARLIEAEPEGPAEKINRMTASLRESAANVKHLRDRVQPNRTARIAAQLQARGEFEREQKARAEERKRREPARRAVGLVASFAHAELRGLTLAASRLDVSEGEALFSLASERCDGPLSARKERSYQRLAGKLAGDEQAFERAQTVETEAKTAERARLDSMPARCYQGKGGCFLPGSMLASLLDADEDGLSVADVGILAVIVLALEQGVSPFARSENVDGRIVLDNAHAFSFKASMNPDGELGERRVRDACAYLAGNGWLDVGRTGDGRTSVGLGPHARRLIEEATTPDVT